jgi:hypothetical protein
MGYPTDGRMKLIVAGGNNFPFSPQDIDNATIIWGRCTDELRGKEVHRRKLSSPEMIRPPPMRQSTTLEMDIMAIDKVLFLVAVSQYGYILTAELDKTWSEQGSNKSAQILFTLHR